jgi:6,7-dimethyl-8-ribityllumazine synthase
MSSIKKHLKSQVKARKGTKIAIAVSDYNSVITHSLLTSCQTELVKRGVRSADVKVVHVPGAFELPFACQKLASKKTYHAIITLGCLIKGETPHFDYIASSATQGIMNVGLQHKIPVIFGVLTTKNLAQARERIKGGKAGDKGLEASISALTMINLKF